MATAGKHHRHHESRHVKVPDGGFGWFVVVAMFLVFMLVAGGFFSFGVLYVALLDAFGGSQAETGLRLFVCDGFKLTWEAWTKIDFRGPYPRNSFPVPLILYESRHQVSS